MDMTRIKLDSNTYATVQEDHEGRPYVQIHTDDWIMLSARDIRRLYELLDARRAALGAIARLNNLTEV